MKFGKSLWGSFCFSFQNISLGSGVNTDNVHLLTSSSKVWFMRAFYFSLPSTIKPGK